MYWLPDFVRNTTINYTSIYMPNNYPLPHKEVLGEEVKLPSCVNLYFIYAYATSITLFCCYLRCIRVTHYLVHQISIAFINHNYIIVPASKRDSSCSLQFILINHETPKCIHVCSLVSNTTSYRTLKIDFNVM